MAYQRDTKMEELLHFDHAKIRKVNMFRRCLSPTGFEEYVAEYHKAIHGIPTVVRGGMDDEGIDIEAEYYKNGRRTRLLVQCKRWSGIRTEHDHWHISKPDVAEFYGNVADIRHSLKYDVRLLYVTTAYFTAQAQKFCKSKGIEMVNYFELLKMDQEFPLESFIRIRIRSGEGVQESFYIPQLKRLFPAYSDIETEIKEVRKNAADQFEILQKEIEAMDKSEAVVPEPRIIEADAVLVTRQTPQELPRPDIPSAKREFDADKLLRSVLMGVAVLLTAFVILVAIAIALQRSVIATPSRASVPTYYPPFQNVTVQKKKNQPVVRKKNVHVTATGGLH